ncbi:uncharacterized protein BO72DRAFT_494668 [Aspergillus fijiensis CBS 313.89]|uniref:Uncharacterized protein n=1 Tax=Aspergillus fijiensis CBS 313.89 TaxID=1448319 RepID=A0A8G1W387_9EURO|nr:uncharacterized protein BO72DRAFT_494668 [Aspergillus fijiensis CBS 313.89]RAK78829.1 hypothetical protein BO72DRAFT_494668 [Aspergillus fijiensis CBS 313.89]
MESVPNSSLGVSSSRLALIDRFPPTTYKGVKDLNKLIVARRDQLYEEVESASQYLSFKDVSPQQFNHIVEREEGPSSHVRLYYFLDIETLIVRIPARETETAHLSFSNMVIDLLIFRVGASASFQLSAVTATPGLTCRTFWGLQALHNSSSPKDYEDDFGFLVTKAS